ncbi:MAG: hypothetical protein JWM85_1299 [Acidimicrobiaceae bacterium]|nr:hypothetical protein [Acidimicrobiaceae bacterium]
MGHLGSAVDTFWELFHRSSPSAHWSLVTPPGVADNGGLVSSGAGHGLVVGFETSQSLAFSPLARSTDGGTRWSGGVLPGPLAGVPDALASSAGGQMMALLGDGGTTLDASGGSLLSWSTVVHRSKLATSAAGSRCGVLRLTAVGVTQSGTRLVGAACSHPGVVGLLESTGSGWRLEPVTLASSAAGSPVEVLRLQDGQTGTSALVASLGSTTRLLVLDQRAGARAWSVSASLSVPKSWRVASAGTLGDGREFALVASGSRQRLEVLGAHGWRSEPAPPSGTATIASAPAGGLDALVVSGGQLTDARLAAGSSAWRTVQRVAVSIPYGSSG